MMKHCSKILIMLFLIFNLSFPVIAQVQKLSVHAHTGVAHPQEKNIPAGLETGFGFSLPLAKSLSLSFDFSYWNSTTEKQAGKLMAGKLEMAPFLLTLEYFSFKENWVNPYLLCGAGFIFSSFKVGQYISIPEVTFRQKIENGPAVLFGVGTTIRIVKNLFLFGEGKYLYRQAAGKTIITDMNLGTLTEEFSVNLSSFIFHLGARYFF